MLRSAKTALLLLLLLFLANRIHGWPIQLDVDDEGKPEINGYDLNEFDELDEEPIHDLRALKGKRALRHRVRHRNGEELHGSRDSAKERERRLSPFPGPDHEFIPDEDIPNAVRSPCPIINTLANHGFINRNGRNILTSHLSGNLSAIFPVDTTFPDGPIAAARDTGLLDYIAGPNGDGTVEVINLNRLHEHNIIEHDASFVRQDRFFAGPEPDQDPKLVQQLVSNAADGRLTIEHIRHRQGLRIQNSVNINPEFTLDISTGGASGAATQAALLLILDQDYEQETVRVATIRAFLGRETFPDGYHPQENFSPGFALGRRSDGSTCQTCIDNRDFFHHFVNKEAGLPVSLEDQVRFEGNFLSRITRNMRGKGKGSRSGARSYSRSYLDPDIEPKPFINCIPCPHSLSRSASKSKGKGGKGKGNRRRSRRNKGSRRYLKRRSRGKGGSSSSSSRSFGGRMGTMGRGGGRGRQKKLPCCPRPTFPPTFLPTVTPFPTFTPLPTVTPFPSFTPFPTEESSSQAPIIAPSVSSRPSARPSSSSAPSASKQPSSTPSMLTAGPTTRNVMARLSYGFFGGTTIREATTAEINGLVVQTQNFYTDILRAAYPTSFSRFSMSNVVQTFTSAANLPIIIDFDAAVVFTTDSANTPTEAQVFSTIQNANYDNYIMEYVWNSTPTGTIFFDTQRVSFGARGG